MTDDRSTEEEEEEEEDIDLSVPDFMNVATNRCCGVMIIIISIKFLRVIQTEGLESMRCVSVCLFHISFVSVTVYAS